MNSRQKKKSSYTFTPARQRALARRSYTLGALVVILVLIALAQFGEDGLATLFRLQKKEKSLAADVQKLRQHNAELDQRLQGLAHDPAQLEKMAREGHNMRREDEEVLTVVPVRDPAEPSAR